MRKLDFKDANVWFDFSDGVDVSDVYIQAMIDETVESLIDEKNGSDFSLKATGNTAVIGYRCYYETKTPVEINIIVTQNYKEATLHKETRWELD